jgi:hypothetical protein
MLEKFEVKNYKNFKDSIVIDFGNIGGYQFSAGCITNNVISKMLIYGRNATGKTNLGEAIMDIGTNLSTLRMSRFNDKVFINADSNDDYAEFIYTFKFNNINVIYKYSKFSNMELRDEELIIDENRIFSCNFYTNDYNFDNLSYISAESVVIERYLDSIIENDNSEELDLVERALPFLRWLISNSALTTNSILLKLDDYVRRMSMLTVGSMVMYRPKRMYDNFFEILNDKNELKEFEEFLNLMGVECHLVLKKLPDGQNELYFKHKKLIPFYENASSGTLALLNLYRRFFVGKTRSMMYLDEFDAFYHFEMAENLLKYFIIKFPNCQIILTSHNTNLMSNRLLRPDCLFILSRSGELTSLSNATHRELREGHNLEKMYISGEFDKYE